MKPFYAQSLLVYGNSKTDNITRDEYASNNTHTSDNGQQQETQTKINKGGEKKLTLETVH